MNNNKRIAKNTLMLYFRMLLIMFVSLYTSRVTLKALGITDYGLYNVLAGSIVIFSFINNSLATATTRFITFHLNEKNTDNIKNIFSTSVHIHLFISLIVIILSELIGIWGINNILNIPTDRIFACNIVFQIVIFSAVTSILQSPFGALIISNEKMNIYAYIGIIDALSKLIIALLITITPYDRLISFSILQFIAASSIFFFYYYYCKQTYSSIFYISKKKNYKLIKEMLGFSSWNLLGSTAIMLKNQGVNILINIFFGPAINAANGIAYQVNSAVFQFSNNFTTAINPQIIKSYAANDKERMKNLIIRGGKFSFFLLTFLTVPIIAETNYLLTLWLGEFPAYTITLTRLVLFLTLIECFNYPISCAIQATGNIRNYQIIISGMNLLIFPFSYISYKLEAPPQTALTISLSISFCLLFIRLYFIYKQLGFSPFIFFKEVYCKSFIILAICLPIPLFISTHLDESLLRLFITTATALIVNTFIIYKIGLSIDEKKICNK
ncbi:hypothetical protein NXW67_17770 [Bacteroides fragilis]|nr:hypothetical protein [Bacteroides fragilis]